jgi:hypothetical protein
MKLKVFGESIPVKVIKNLKDQGILGKYDSKNKEISICSSTKASDKDQVLLHELTHCVIDVLGLYNAQLSHDLEEILADNISKAITDNFRLTWKSRK